MFTVWEPIIATDFGAPRRWALGTLPDNRVRQYWDPEARVARQLARDARPPQPEPDCCERAGVLWDIVAVYPRGAVWDDRMPPAVVFSGPLIDMADAVEAALAGTAGPQPSAVAF